MKNLIFALLICCLALACSKHESETAKVATPPTAARSIEAIADEYLSAMLERYPEYGTNFSLPGARHDRLVDNSLAARAAWQAKEDAWLKELDETGPPSEIGSRDWVSFGILYETLAGEKASRICRSELWAASTTTAWYNNTPSLFEIQPVDTPELQSQALARLTALTGFIDNEITNLREGLALGYSAPKVTVEQVPASARGLLTDDSPLLSPGARSENPEFATQLRAVFDQDVAPAIERFADYIETEYLPLARLETALSANPDGAACYPNLVRQFATITIDPDKVHSLGLEQIAAIREEMQAIIDENFQGETIESLMANLNISPDYTFKTRDDVLQYALESVGASKAAMAEVFGLQPKADMLIKPYPAYREASGTGEYHSSSEDGTRPGIYYIAVVDPTHRSIAGQQSVLYHEGYPGHHFQGAIALELGDKVHPIARYLWNSGHGEGWALYSERLAHELGLYSGPLDKIGMLSDQAARAARLVIDTGLHTKGWSQQQAVDYMLANTAWPPVDIEAEIKRYISWPGQANSYMLGMLEIRRLRDLAEAELGESFDIRGFHDQVLGYGNINLPMVAEAVTTWVAKQR